MRLIKRVRVSVIALIPSIQGIRATLTSSGISRVVNEDGSGIGIFHTIEVLREPEKIAFTSPNNATGIFELDAQSDMRLPFEFSGVDTSWELKMPRSANPFDFSTIADVYFTIEYSALHNYDYEQQVIKNLENTVSSDLTFSMSEKFADEWYNLVNFDQIEEQKQLLVDFNIREEDFPSNVENIRLQEVMMFFSIDDEKKSGIVAQLSKKRPPTPQDASETHQDGIISTRRSQWPKLKQEVISPIGEWKLSLRTSDPIKDFELRNMLKNDKIKDIIFVITYKGELPKWP